MSVAEVTTAVTLHPSEVGICEVVGVTCISDHYVGHLCWVLRHCLSMHTYISSCVSVHVNVYLCSCCVCVCVCVLMCMNVHVFVHRVSLCVCP